MNQIQLLKISRRTVMNSTRVHIHLTDVRLLFVL